MHLPFDKFEKYFPSFLFSKLIIDCLLYNLSRTSCITGIWHLAFSSQTSKKWMLILFIPLDRLK